MVGPGLNVDIASCSLYPKNTSTRKETSSFRNRVGVRLIRKLCAYFTIHQCTSADQIRSICIFSHAAVFPKKKIVRALQLVTLQMMTVIWFISIVEKHECDKYL